MEDDFMKYDNSYDDENNEIEANSDDHSNNNDTLDESSDEQYSTYSSYNDTEAKETEPETGNYESFNQDLYAESHSSDNAMSEESNTVGINEETPQNNETSEDSEETPDDNKKNKKKNKKDKAPKEKKPMTKAKKITLIVVSVILVIAIIATSITVPIVIANKDKIFVSEAADFNNTDGTYFVLKNDVTVDGDLNLGDINSIDFNGNTLTVTGTLRINSANANEVIMGGKSKNNYNSDGVLQAGNIEVTCPNADFVASVLVKTNLLKVTSKSFLLADKGANLSNNAEIKSSSVNILAPLEFSDKNTNNSVIIKDAGIININAIVSGNIDISNNYKAAEGYSSNASIKGTVSGNILADSNTSLTISSRIGGIIDSNVRDAETGIAKERVGKVKLMENAAVKEIKNAEIVYIHENVVFPDLTSVGTVETIKQLDRVTAINVNDDTDKIILTFGTVDGADAYIVTIDNNESITIMEPMLDITKYVSSPEKHLIKVQAVSTSAPELLLPSESSIYEYRTYMTLARPTNIKVTTNDEGKYILSFDKVNFADEYSININGTVIVTDKTNVDITSYLTRGGNYVFEIIAKSKNDNIKSSKAGVYQYKHYISLTTPVLRIINDQSNIIFSWDPVPEADYYRVIRINGEEEETVFYTSSAEFKVSLSNEYGIESGQTFIVEAISNNGYYTMSRSEQVTYKYVPVA